MEKAIKVRGRYPLFPCVVLWRSSRLQPQKAGRFCSERFHRLLVFGLLWIPWIALYSPGAKGVGVRLGVCPTPTSFLGECDLCSARTEVSVLETLSSVNEWDEESPATTTRFDHSPRAAGICFRMVYSTWRVGIYPSLPICLKSTSGNLQFRKKVVRHTKPVLCQIGCPHFSVCSPPFLFPLLSPRKH